MTIRRHCGRLAVLLGAVSIAGLGAALLLYLTLGNSDTGDSLAYAFLYVGYPAGLGAFPLAVAALTHRDTRHLGLIGAMLALPSLALTAAVAFLVWLMRDFEPSF